MDPIDRDVSYRVLGTRLHLERQDRVASVDDHVADPDPRIEVAMREVERAEPREIRFDGANFVQWHSRPDAGDQVPDFKVLQHLPERVGLERRISREADFANSRGRSAARGSIALARRRPGRKPWAFSVKSWTQRPTPTFV